ncbi:MAG: cytochrome c [Acidobacteria bacterium]|nr:cytochrome c [Acidobacteriota bacterium]
MTATRVIAVVVVSCGVACGVATIGAAQSPATKAPATKPPATNQPATLGIGRPATPAEIAAWDIDVQPDGTGLPSGGATSADGAPLYAARCAACHGRTGKEGPNDRLVGRLPGDAFPFARDPRIPKTIGDYWPYATTVFDYIRRAMPPDAPGSLKDDEVYGLTAYLLFLNDLIPADAVIDAKSLPKVVMPARDRFVPDPRGGPKAAIKPKGH